MLSNPGDVYATGDETVKTALNRAIFAKFMIDGTKVVVHQMNKPFDSVMEAQRRVGWRAYQRNTGGAQFAEPSEADLEAWAIDLGR